MMFSAGQLSTTQAAIATTLADPWTQRTLPTRPGVRPHRRRRPTTRPQAAVPRALRGGRRRRRRSGHRPAGRLGRRLVEIARQSLDAEEPPARRERFRINLFLDPTADLPSSWIDRTTPHPPMPARQAHPPRHPRAHLRRGRPTSQRRTSPTHRARPDSTPDTPPRRAPVASRGANAPAGSTPTTSTTGRTVDLPTPTTVSRSVF